MQKIALILFLTLFCTSCSVVRRSKKIDYSALNINKTETRLENLKSQNITASNFFIQKAEIGISSHGEKEKVIGSIKYEKPDKFLISIKNRTGIEALRIFISIDTILVNDRINRKLLYAAPDYLRSKYGISNKLFAIILGDYISDNVSEQGITNCMNGKLDLDEEAGGIKIKYIINCKFNKVLFASTEERFKGRKIEVRFDNFRKRGDILAPQKIEIIDINAMTNIVIHIKKIEYPWSGKIEFIPGSRYEKRILQ